MNSAANPKPRVAVVDDDQGLRRLIHSVLERNGYNVAEGADGADAVALVREGGIAAMVLDVRMPRMSGLEALEIIKKESPSVAIVLLTAFIDVRDAVAAIKTGAHDYLEKPVDLDELVVAVDEALGHARKNLPARDPVSSQAAPAPEGIVMESPMTTQLFAEAYRVAQTDATTLLLGESGTGKEVLARYIHEHSARCSGPFVAVNCAAFPESLIESELFGHEKGAFTGATGRHKGQFEMADGGTLLLDEIAEMPLALQPKLLRVLETRRFRRVGGTGEVEVNVRIIASTNREIDADAREGRFREDLLYRLNVITLRIPPLRERPEDVAALARLFLRQQEAEGNIRAAKRFSPAAERALAEHDWPGNVRELRNAVARAAIISRGSLILPEDLPEAVRASAARPCAAASAHPDEAKSSVLVGDMETIQKQAILEALDKTDGNKTKAAKILGISRRTLIYKLRSYGM